MVENPTFIITWRFGSKTEGEKAKWRKYYLALNKLRDCVNHIFTVFVIFLATPAVLLLALNKLKDLCINTAENLGE